MPALEGPVGAPEVFSDYFRLMADLMVLSWQTDLTRVITFQMGHEMSGRAYPELGFGDSHHSYTHHQGEPEKKVKTIPIKALHTKMLAYYLDKLRDTRDGDGSLLDHSMILYGAALSDANLHLYTDLPLVLVAGGINGIKGGTACAVSQADADDQSAADHAGQGRCAPRGQAGRQHRKARLGASAAKVGG